MKKVLYCNQSMGMGGAEVFMTDLLAELQQKGWQILVVTTRPEFARYLTAHSLVVEQLPFIMDVIGNWKGFVKAFVFGPLSFLQWLVILLRSVSQARNTVVLLSGCNEQLLLTGIAKLLGFKVVWIQFSALGNIANLWGGLVGWWFAWSIQQVDTIITSSNHSKQAIVLEQPVTAKQVVVIPCGRKLQAKSYIKNSSEKIICVSRLQPGKGQDLLIKAMPTVLQSHPGAQLYIVGEGDFKTRLQKLARTLGLEKQVVFKGRVDSIEKELAVASISVFPSVWELEGFGLVLIEAMAAAKPIVTFDRGPMNEIIQHQKNGLLAKTGSVEDLASKITLLLADEKMQKKLAVQAAKDFEARYTIQKIAQEYAKNLPHHHR